MKARYIIREKMPVGLGPPPKAANKNISRSMKSNRARDTKPEILLKQALRKNRLKGYRSNWEKIPGRPDICFIKEKVAIFVNGCFWHRCPYCKLKLPKSNKVFWRNKFRRNKERDALKVRRLKKIGWKALTVWECQVRKRVDKTVERIQSILGK